VEMRDFRNALPRGNKDKGKQSTALPEKVHQKSMCKGLIQYQLPSNASTGSCAFVHGVRAMDLQWGYSSNLGKWIGMCLCVK